MPGVQRRPRVVAGVFAGERAEQRGVVGAGAGHGGPPVGGWQQPTGASADMAPRQAVTGERRPFGQNLRAIYLYAGDGGEPVRQLRRDGGGAAGRDQRRAVGPPGQGHHPAARPVGERVLA